MTQVVRLCRSVCALALLSSAAMSYAWIDTGHMVVARIAEGRLTDKAKQEIAKLVAVSTDEKTDTFTTVSCWADENKSDKDRHWHYADTHFRADGKPSRLKPDKENVVWAIERFEKVLADKGASTANRAEALRYLVHFVGDVHMPLHTLARDSEKFPEGDRGGNDFKVGPINGWGSRPITNLHILWDFGCGEFMPISRPLDAEGEANLQSIVSRIVRDHPYSSLMLVERTDPAVWATEGYALRKKVYGMPEGTYPTNEYLERGRNISRQRAAYAGYRLANLLNRSLD